MKTRILFLGTILSLLVAFVATGQPGSANFTAIRLINAGDGSTVPSINGSIFYNQSTNKFRAYEGGAWKDLIGGGGAAFSLGSLNGSTKSADGGAYTSGTFYLQTADETYPGLVSTGAQTFAGSKTFSGNATFNGWVTLNSRVPIGTNSFFLADATNGFRVHNSDNTAVRFKVHDSGQTDIGGPLNVSASSGSYGSFNHSASGAAYWTWRYNNTAYGYTGHAKGVFGTAQSDTEFGIRAESKLHLGIGTSVGATLTASGLGLGTTTPNAPLQFSNNLDARKIVLYEHANNNHQITGFGSGSGGYLRYIVHDTGVDHVWLAGTSSTTSNELMRLTGTGILKFPNLTGRKISLWENGNNDHQFYGIALDGTGPRFQVPSTTANFVWSAGTSSTASSELMKLEGTGRLSLTTSSVNSNFTMVQTGANALAIAMNRTGAVPTHWQIYVGAGTTDLKFHNVSDRFTFSAAGTGTATDWVATSDRRLKENVKPVGSQLEKVEAIAELVRNYDRKDNGKNETGFIAQELAEVAPEYVNEGNDSVMWSVNYSKMTPVLFKAVAELQAEIKSLKEELNKHKQCAH